MATEPSPGDDRRIERRAGPLRPVMDALYGFIRWIVGHVRGFYTAAGVFLAVGLGLAVLATGLFGLIAEWMVGGATQAFDTVVVEWIRARQAPWLDWLALAGAALGSGLATWIVLGVGSIVLWFTRHHISVLLLWIALLGGRLLSAELKALFDRPRPEPLAWDLAIFGSPIDFPASPSFPSGHAVTSVILFGTLAYLVVRLEPTVTLRRITLAVAALLILLIGLSRVYLGVHYPSDVLAGYLAGFVWATFAAFATELVRYLVYRKPEVVREEKDLEKGMRPVREAVQGEEG
jgi:undecaprenyl-diphosphatase